jgi:glycosyltransferase involved in cell wall biosynthesis
LRVALVHDWLTGMRGGERVLDALCEICPDAELFTLLHVPGSVSRRIEARPVHTSALQRLPAARRYYKHYLPLFPTLIEQFNFDRFDLVISSSHCVAKSVVVPGRIRHLCYCHSPMRYAWDQFDAYFGPGRIGAGASRIMRYTMARMARWDRDTADRVGTYLTNSQHVAGRIRRYYNREATVVYPPVDTDFFTPADGAGSPGNDDLQCGPKFALVVSALVPYKRLETAIDACRLARIPLTIAGDGPERARLAQGVNNQNGESATNGVTFVGRRSDEEIRDLYRRASVVLMPGEEDFGIVPVEAQACGTPVVALARGGALETVVDGVTGALVADPRPQAFADAISRAIVGRFDRDAMRAHAHRFGKPRFIDKMRAVVAAAGASA